MEAVNDFEKDNGAPDTILWNSASDQKQNSLQKFLDKIGTTFKVLEEGTPQENKSDKYIGLITKEVQKYIKECNCPITFCSAKLNNEHTSTI